MCFGKVLCYSKEQEVLVVSMNQRIFSDSLNAAAWVVDLNWLISWQQQGKKIGVATSVFQKHLDSK